MFCPLPLGMRGSNAQHASHLASIILPDFPAVGFDFPLMRRMWGASTTAEQTLIRDRFFLEPSNLPMNPQALLYAVHSAYDAVELFERGDSPRDQTQALFPQR